MFLKVSLLGIKLMFAERIAISFDMYYSTFKKMLNRFVNLFNLKYMKIYESFQFFFFEKISDFK